MAANTAANAQIASTILPKPSVLTLASNESSETAIAREEALEQHRSTVMPKPSILTLASNTSSETAVAREEALEQHRATKSAATLSPESPPESVQRTPTQGIYPESSGRHAAVERDLPPENQRQEDHSYTEKKHPLGRVGLAWTAWKTKRAIAKEEKKLKKLI